MRRIIQKFYLSSFYFITLIFSFILLTMHFRFQSAGYYSISFPQFAPALAVIFIAFILKDKSILFDIKCYFSLHPINKKWIIPTLILPMVCIIISSVFMSLIDLPYRPWTGNIQFYLINILAILLGCIGEEIGWRGFLLPKLQERYSSLISSIIVGILWGIWHLNFTGGVLSFILYTVTVIEMSILMTWLFNSTNGNMFLMITWHFIFNLSSHIFLWERFNTQLLFVESIVFGILCMIIVISNFKKFFFKISDQSKKPYTKGF